jgi:hypothetical protein
VVLNLIQISHVVFFTDRRKRGANDRSDLNLDIIGTDLSCLRSLCLFTYSCDQHVPCCDFVFVWCLVYGGDQHILCCVFCFVCLRLVSSVLNLHSL